MQSAVLETDLVLFVTQVSGIRDDETSYATSTVVTYTCNDGFKFLAKVNDQRRHSVI